MIQSIPFHEVAYSSSKRQPMPAANNRRSRLVVLSAVLAGLLLAAGFITMLFGNADAYAADPQPASHAFIVVNSGDTLWGIASEFKSPKADIKEYIYEIKKLNGMKNSSLMAGQKLLIP
ncbi:LysM peptidoglycan-binding domain-containing protein [Paenibacillus filicis]|uniref:LysM peptidoglycan-binding domain-containing protein n=1 Tax=Paenibacillus filicis TaxID=669464 RepID=A0ABU9DIF2_9BACL